MPHSIYSSNADLLKREVVRNIVLLADMPFYSADTVCKGIRTRTGDMVGSPELPSETMLPHNA